MSQGYDEEAGQYVRPKVFPDEGIGKSMKLAFLRKVIHPSYSIRDRQICIAYILAGSYSPLLYVKIIYVSPPF